MDDAMITAIATGLLVVVGLAQIGVLVAQKRQARLALAAYYRDRWQQCNEYWRRVVFIGRGAGDYYQVVDQATIDRFKTDVSAARLDAPTIWARDSIRSVFGIMSDVSMRLLQRQLEVSGAYPVFGTELLRHSRPLRKLLDPDYCDAYNDEGLPEDHKKVRKEVQNWLIYHDGVRRRCLILLDLLWAEAARLEDLPPSDLRSAAEAKKSSGKLNRLRVFREARRLNGWTQLWGAWRMSRFLRHSEFSTFWNRSGINSSRLDSIEDAWTDLLLREYRQPKK